MKNILYLVLFFSIIKTINAQVPPVERAALQTFFTATNGTTWNSENDGDPTNDWDFSGPVTGNWYGLTLAGGNVTGIDMNPTNFFTGGNIQSGSIPNELADLQSLTILDISACGLTGNLPVSITTLPNLLTLNVWANDLDGTIPVEVTDMVQLTRLVLGVNEFTGSIYQEYGNLVNLTYLGLDGNNLTGSIPATLGNLTALRTLRLGHQELMGNLPVSLRNLTQLVELSISSTYISGNLPPEYSEMINLQELYLSSYSNVLDGGLTGSIPDSYGNLVNLRELNLWGNALSGTLPESLSNWVNLEYFNIGNNQISGMLSPNFSNWTNIREFAAYNNLLEGTIPDSYSNFSQIERFSVDTNSLSGVLPPSFSQWMNILSFDVSRNQLSGTLPVSYSQWSLITHFSVQSNAFSGNIPAAYNQWNNLKVLSANGNELEGTVPDFSGISGFDQVLTISNNRFQFGDFENQFTAYDTGISFFTDNPQAKVNDIETLNHATGDNITLVTTVSGAQNHYRWFKDGVAITGAPDSPTLLITNAQTSDTGVYHCEITSDIVTDLTLIRNDIILSVGCISPTADDSQDVTACGSYTLPTLSSNNHYFTAASAGGTQLNAGDVITSSQTLFIYTGSPGCSDENSFVITIDTLVTVDFSENVEDCESYTLPVLANGNYFTESGGAGTELRANDAITTTQTIYIYFTSGSCSDESSFEVTIDPTQCPEKPTGTCEVKFPKFFTPNNDGTNDRFRAMENKCDQDGNLHIYDRYGKLLFQTDISGNGWDGNFKGIRLPSTDYWYQFVNAENGHVSTGHFSLKR